MTPKDMMVIDTNAEELGVSKSSLMENAGKSVADYIKNTNKPCKVAIFAGSGGNGGDGFVAARHLLNHGFQVEIFLLTHPDLIKSKESREKWDILQNMNPSISQLKINLINDSSLLKTINANIVIDSILGTGIQGKLKEPISTAVDLINENNELKISVDVPTGLDPLNGTVIDKAVYADVTITFHKAKRGLNYADKYVGKLIVNDIGIPKEAEIFTGKGDLLRLKKRTKHSHKGNNGKVLVIGGSKYYSGAPALAALSALKSGVDLVYVASPDVVASNIRSYSPDLIVRSFSEDVITMNDANSILELSNKVDSVLIGCGLGRDEKTVISVRYILSKVTKPVVIDADALHMLDEEILNNIKKTEKKVVLTPHSGEFKAIFGAKISEKLDNNIKTVKNSAYKSKTIILLKGVVDIITDGKNIKLNQTGNSGMTVGGTGDCLAGLVAGLLSQGHDTFESAYLAAYINGKAGDLALKKHGFNFTASEQIKLISKVFMPPID
ncbi:MAG: NAD(P)H-hydrate dehydratase [Methanomicrobiales archaeon]